MFQGSVGHCSESEEQREAVRRYSLRVKKSQDSSQKRNIPSVNTWPKLNQSPPTADDANVDNKSDRGGLSRKESTSTL